MRILRNSPSPSPANYIVAIILVWLVALMVIGVLQMVGAQFGFKVWALGEDRVWLRFIQNSPEQSLVHAWWATNDRNPLSAWWWLAISPLVHYSEWFLYIVRRCFDPILAICTFLLLDQLGRKQSRAFAFSVALVVVLWNFSSYYESVLWDMLGALALTLLTLLFYCRYVDSNRANGNYLALAMVCYFIAISTYTIQSGAVIGVAALAFFRKPFDGHYCLSERIKNTLKDSSYFFAIFILYNCIWYTVNRNSDVYYIFNLPLFLTQFQNSLHQFWFHPSFSMFFGKIIKDWSTTSTLTILASVFLICSFIMSKWNFRQMAKVEGKATAMPIGWVIAILLSIAVPTVLLESTSNIWAPGTRSLMVQQVWQPLLYVSCIFVIANFFFKSLRNTIAIVGVSMLCAIIFLIGLDYNYRLVIRTAYQRNLVAEINKLNIPYAPSTPFAFLVKMSDTSNEDLNSIYLPITMFSQTVFRNIDKTVRPIVADYQEAFAKYWKVNLGKDEEGVFNGRTLGDERVTPYKNLLIVFFDGKKLTVPEKIEKNDLEGLQMIWNRNEPINQRENHPGLEFSVKG